MKLGVICKICEITISCHFIFSCWITKFRCEKGFLKANVGKSTNPIFTKHLLYVSKMQMFTVLIKVWMWSSHDPARIFKGDKLFLSQQKRASQQS